MFDENEEVIANFAGNIIFQSRKEIGVKSVNFNVIGTGKVRIKQGVT